MAVYPALFTGPLICQLKALTLAYFAILASFPRSPLTSICGNTLPSILICSPILELVYKRVNWVICSSARLLAPSFAPELMECVDFNVDCTMSQIHFKSIH